MKVSRWLFTFLVVGALGGWMYAASLAIPNAHAQAKAPAGGGSVDGTAIAPSSVSATGAISGTTITGSGAISGTTVTGSGAVTGSAVVASGASAHFTTSSTTAIAQFLSARADASVTTSSPAAQIGSSATVAVGDTLLDVVDASGTSLRIRKGASSGAYLSFVGTTGLISADNSTGLFLAWGSAGSETATVVGDGSGLRVGGSGFFRIQSAASQGAGAPTGTDCDASGEAGRVYIDTSNHKWCFCEGAAGWKCATGS